MADYKTADVYENQRLVEDGITSQPVPKQHASFRARLFRHVIPCVLLLLSVSILFRKVFVCRHQTEANGQWFAPDGNNTNVALEAHIMSKCPDARDCLQQLVVPAMAQVSDMVDFRLSYIGSFESKSDDVHCKHGPSECLGNIIQLCAAEEYPDPKIYLGFANCMTSRYQEIPDQDLVEGCAMEHGIDFQRINTCISQEGNGMDLLRRSIKHSQDVHVSTSCTVRLEGEVRCVRDGGKWSNCPGGSFVEELVSDIRELYHRKNSA